MDWGEAAFSFFLAWFSEHGITVALILVGALVLHYIGGFFIHRAIRNVVREGDGSPASEEKREDTLIQVVDGVVHVLIWVVATMMVLSELGVAIGPLLAAAGIAGVAVGFGGQYLIRDVITGLFILLENQYRVGDVVCFDGTCGSVEHISLRMTTLRDLDGTVHHVPHGEVKKVSNLTKGFARVNMVIGVSYDADIEQVTRVVNEVGEAMAQDPAWSDDIISPPKFLRIDNFGDSSVDIRVLGDTQPSKQWDVAGEYRKRLKVAFDKEGIEIPFPQRVLHQTKR